MMKPFTFSMMLLLQRADEALRLERQKSAGNPRVLMLLRRRKDRLVQRLTRSLAMLDPARR